MLEDLIDKNSRNDMIKLLNENNNHIWNVE